MSKKDPETAIVTGASCCIGEAVAEHPAGDGLNVVINYAGEHGSAAALVARIQQVGWGAMVHQADVSDAEADDASFDRHVSINLKGVFNGLREASKRIGLEDLLSPRINQQSERESPMDARAIRCSRESDTQLLIAVAAGNRIALEKLYLGYQRRLARFLWRFTRCRESIEEITNDTFMVVWRNASGFRFASAPSSWIFGIAYRTALKSMRRDGDHPAACSLGDRERTVDPILETEMQDWLAHGLERLPEEQRTALEFAYAGYPLAQIGEITGVPIGTVKTRLFHGRQNLRQCLPILGGGIFELSAGVE